MHHEPGHVEDVDAWIADMRTQRLEFAEARAILDAMEAAGTPIALDLQAMTLSTAGKVSERAKELRGILIAILAVETWQKKR